ncbi:hypothetical protein OK94_21740 [Salmonella enterica]|uniref:Uncharacterized protein n=1 Tax=Salmonella enterica TaxID=28901 RepID=A0A750HQY0_SALER|nr:hypothetical protein [Salmonella enterica subsp. enterica serovar Nottingham]EAO9321723.1 hypothetical protein [Salmonella enterica]EEG1124374.1 hypothetical protein [Salmonella enterica subsp. diarizonae]EIG0952012.1 hypothetical protein [Salmonella enterica subsp. enterica serovar Muenchen]EAT1860579.1 hypothetical protein [Salmonella enterica]
MSQKKLGIPGNTTVIYVGKVRYRSLGAHAREISYLSNTDIKATTFLHYLIDEFADKAHTKLLDELKNKIKTPEED